MPMPFKSKSFERPKLTKPVPHPSSMKCSTLRGGRECHKSKTEAWVTLLEGWSEKTLILFLICFWNARKLLKGWSVNVHHILFVFHVFQCLLFDIKTLFLP